MKGVLLNDQGYTADGKWRLVVVDPKPEMSAKGLCVSEAEHDPAGVYRAMIAASPAPVLAEAVSADWRSVINEFIGEAEQTYCPDSTCGYPDARCCRESMKRLVDEAKALLQSPSALIVERLDGTSIQARLSADANVLIEDGYIMRAANIKEAIGRIADLESENQALRAELDEWKQAAQTAAFTVEVLSAELADLREKPSKQQIENLAGEIAVNVARNCASVPQLTFPHIYLGLLDFFELSSKLFAESDVDKIEIDRLRQAIKSEAQYCFHWRDESLKKGDADRAMRHEERGLRLMSHIDAAKGVDRG